MGDERRSQLDGLWSVVKSVPIGRVASYGAVGRALDHPASGYFVGKWMAMCPDDDTPWWRIVNAKGELPINKRDPNMAHEQRTRLEKEGVTFTEGVIDKECFWDPSSLF